MLVLSYAEVIYLKSCTVPHNSSWHASLHNCIFLPVLAGEAAKQVSKLALQRVRELQTSVEDARLEAASKAARVAELEEQVAAHEAAAKAAQVGEGGVGSSW